MLRGGGFSDRVPISDRIEVIDALSGGSANMLFADPPYNPQLVDLHRGDNSRVDAVGDDRDKVEDFAAYDPFGHAWMKAAHAEADRPKCERARLQ